jgi:hypothetical protein
MIMGRFRPLLGILLAVIATTLVACGGGPASKVPTTYTPAVLQQVELFVLLTYWQRDSRQRRYIHVV